MVSASNLCSEICFQNQQIKQFIHDIRKTACKVGLTTKRKKSAVEQINLKLYSARLVKDNHVGGQMLICSMGCQSTAGN